MKRPRRLLLPVLGIFVFACTRPAVELQPLQVSDNNRFLVDQQRQPFFWLGDTGWLLFKNLSREEAAQYLEHRKQQGFNVIQVMVLHDITDAVNVYGDSALIEQDVARPMTTPGDSPEDAEAYDFWDHADYIIRLAEEKGFYMALVPVWGSNVKKGGISPEQIGRYGSWLADRYRNYQNVIWLNGGDIMGQDSTAAWQALGNALHQEDPDKLITFHPFGRTQSSMWFHQEPWLDFNMCQSGHRRYDQDNTTLAYGEDNWRYIQSDYQLTPPKPIIDGEPSYEGIPQGLHDTLQPYWNDADLRRYAYWSVFAGAFGFTYGHSAVMQFYRPGDVGSYGPKAYWQAALEAPGAGQMQHLKNLLLSRPFLECIPDQGLIEGEAGERYDHLVATRGTNYALVYNYTGRSMHIRMGVIEGQQVQASWFDPRNGQSQTIGQFENQGVLEFDPPGETAPGNDWVLVLDAR